MVRSLEDLQQMLQVIETADF